MRLITLDDIIDIYVKLNQRGLNFIKSKFHFNPIKRSKSAFESKNIQLGNWWNIPTIKERWNLKVTGEKTLDFVAFTMNNYLKNRKNLKMLSLGSGNCATELKYAEYDNFQDILCCDISDISLEKAKARAQEKNLNNINFKVQDVNKYSFAPNTYDIIFFRASLHHFKNIEQLIGESIKKALKENGILIIDEYIGPNRLQFPNHQIKAINKSLKIVPKKFRKRYKVNLYKNKVYGSGIIRMIIADPSECIESQKILPTINKYFKTIYQATYGGNILAITLKDISHHFIDLDEEKKKILNTLFEFEDDYLKNNPSDFIYGIYQK
ncbi:class I SAM-dependent methyltransferase [Gaetbulibacter sp. M240]|uniref:class I SAM-dependent methyltransferase n=1 Tax=Gaetbulibacter sp. M240 TaxID=3126511 RepID=UPI00374F2885